MSENENTQVLNKSLMEIDKSIPELSPAEAIETLRRDVEVLREALGGTSVSAADSPWKVRSVGEELKSMKVLIDALKQQQEVIASLNQEIVSAFDARKKRIRDLWPIAFGILTLCIGANVGWQFFKSGEVSRALNDANELSNRMKVERESQVKLSGDVSRAVVLLSLGYRDDARDRWIKASRNAMSAMDALKSWEPLIDAQTNPLLIESLKPTDHEAFKSVESLLSSAKETRVAALELRGRTLFRLAGQDVSFVPQLQETGELLERVDPSSWLGPHFHGLALDIKADNEKDSERRAGLRREALKLFQQAAKADPTEGSGDLLNAAESRLLSGSFDEAVSFSKSYMESDPNGPNEQKVAAKFIGNLAAFAIEGTESTRKMAFESVLEVAVTTFRNYDWSGYQSILDQSKTDPSKSPFSTSQRRDQILRFFSAALAASKKSTKYALSRDYPDLSQVQTSRRIR